MEDREKALRARPILDSFQWTEVKMFKTRTKLQEAYLTPRAAQELTKERAARSTVGDDV